MTRLEGTPVVVVGIDGSPEASRAAYWAKRYAALTGAGLRLIAAWEMPMVFGRPTPHDDYEPAKTAREVVTRTTADLGMDSSAVESLVPVGSAGQALVDLSQDAGLLVVGRRGGHSVGHALLGSTTDYCVHHSVIPVVVVPKPDDEWTRIPDATPRVVVGVDGSTDAISGLHWAARYAAAAGAKLNVVTAWEWPLAYGYPTIPPEYAPEVDAKQIAERAIAEVAFPADRIEISVVEGAPGTELVRMSHGADLLVVGTQGHSALGGVLLGSISRHCVHHSTVPVAVITTK